MNMYTRLIPVSRDCTNIVEYKVFTCLLDMPECGFLLRITNDA